jgi:hypothetical protein
MKSYRITVNGNVYDVTVEETTGNGAAPVQQSAAPAPQPVKTQQEALKSNLLYQEKLSQLKYLRDR